MAKKEIANANATFQIQPGGGTGTVSITNPVSTKVKAGGSGVYKGSLTVVVSGGVSGSCGTGTGGASNATGTGTITPTSIKTKAEGDFVIRKDDESTTITMSGTEPASPSGTQPCTYTLTVKCTDAGQIKVLSE